MARVVRGPRLLETLRVAIADGGPVRLAVAFWGAGAVEALGLEGRRDVEVICNLAMGGTNPDEIERLLAAGARVHVLDTLHAKMGVAGGIGFVGSSNVSANGLGLQGAEVARWDELNTVFRSERALDRLRREFEGLRGRAGEALRPGDLRLEAARVRWRRRRLLVSDEHAYPGREQTLLKAMKEDHEWFRDRRAYLALHIQMTAEEEKEFMENAERIKAQHGEHYECYWGWPDLPNDAHLLSVEMTPRGTAKLEGLYLRHSWMPDGGGDFQLCQRAKTICGFEIPGRNEWPQWKQKIEAAWKELPKEARGEAHWVNLHVIAVHGVKAALLKAVDRSRRGEAPSGMSMCTI